ncbi:uncharacterized protein [Rutidosis leptorrhynchoides]|uniref:uncharacterized protein n=1 Tax=Rutidosis leptorrhynchoides TaxID=125765 RepID=UPI003A992198
MPSDRLNCRFNKVCASRFNDFIDRNFLIEIPINGRRFTRISDNGLKFSKLDRFLVNEKFIDLWDDLSITVLDRRESDHCPLILRDKHIDFGSKPFKVFDEWLNQDGIDRIIIEAWGKCVCSTRKDCIFRDKLKNVKCDLRTWSKGEFGNIDGEIKGLKDEVDKWEVRAEQRGLNDEDIECCLNCRRKWIDKEKSKDTGDISKGCNASFITFVPKKLEPIGLNDYRPISLIGCYYKIVAKLLSNRLKRVIPNLVGYEQSAFIKGRNIMDGALIVNETLDFLKHKKSKSLVFKVNFERAFDCLN